MIEGAEKSVFVDMGNKNAAEYLNQFRQIETSGKEVPIRRKAGLIYTMLIDGGLYSYLSSIGSVRHVNGGLESPYDIGMGWVDENTKAEVVGAMYSNREVLLGAVGLAKNAAEGKSVEYTDLRSHGYSGKLIKEGKVDPEAMSQYFEAALRGYEHNPYGVKSDEWQELDRAEVAQMTGYCREVIEFGSKKGLF